MNDELGESARNRGLKLVRSRVRTPGKGDFGKVGLTDGAGTPVFGIVGKKLTATPSDAEAYLRGLLAADWSASLGQKSPLRKRRVGRPAEPEGMGGGPDHDQVGRELRQRRGLLHVDDVDPLDELVPA